MNSIPSNRIALVSALLILPVLFLCACGVLESAIALAAAILAMPPDKMFLSGAMCGVFVCLALNLWTVCRPVCYLIFVAMATLLAGVLLFYVFVENFRIIAR